MRLYETLHGQQHRFLYELFYETDFTQLVPCLKAELDASEELIRR